MGYYDNNFSIRKTTKTLQFIQRFVKKFGPENAKLIRRRLDDLKAAARLEDLRNLFGLHELKGDRAGTFSMRLIGGYRLVFESADNRLPQKPDGGLDWSQIKTIRILNVENYHD